MANDTTNIRIKSEPTESQMDTHFESSGTDNLKPVHMVTDLTLEPIESQLNQGPLLMVTVAAKESLNNPDPVNEPLLVVTSGLTLDQARITEYHPTDAPTRWSHLLNRPVPVSPKDTSSNQTTTTVNQPVFPEPEIELPNITHAPPRTDTTDDDIPKVLQEQKEPVDATQGHNVEPPSTTLKVSTTRGNTLDKVQTDICTTDAPDTSRGNSKTTETSDTMHGNKACEDTPKEASTPSPNPGKSHEQQSHASASKYYDILTPEEDDILSISHEDIISNKCEVSLEKLSNSDLDKIKATLRNQSEDSSSSPSSLDVKPAKKGQPSSM